MSEKLQDREEFNQGEEFEAPETQSQSQSQSQSSRKNKKSKLIIRLVILIILLGLGTWLAIFFLNSSDEEDVFNNLNLNRDGDLVIDGEVNNNESSNTLGGTSDGTPLEGAPSETSTVGSESITLDPNDFRMSQEVPKQSVVIKPEEVPTGSIIIVGTDNGFEPNEFFVSPGQEFILTLTAQSVSPVVLTFYDPTMAAVSIGCGPGDTRYVTFEAPTKTGEYIFVNDVFGKRDQVGKMIVR